MAEHIDVPVFLQVSPKWVSPRADKNKPESIKSGTVTGSTVKKPSRPTPGSVVLKVTLRIPKAAFVALQPEAIVVIPEHLTTGVPIEVTAEDPNQES